MKITDSDGSTGAQRTNYSKTGGTTNNPGTSKELASKSLAMTSGGGESGSGPTGSSRKYAKGSAVNMTPRFNPQKAKASTFGVDGV